MRELTGMMTEHIDLEIEDHEKCYEFIEALKKTGLLEKYNVDILWPCEWPDEVEYE